MSCSFSGQRGPQRITQTDNKPRCPEALKVDQVRGTKRLFSELNEAGNPHSAITEVGVSEADVARFQQESLKPGWTPQPP